MRLEVRNLRYGYTPERQVVQGVSFSVRAGECVAVLGTNGVGKTTMLKCINRILRPQAGEVLVDGQPVHRLSGRELAQRIGYVPQACEFADGSVFDAVLLGRKPFLQWDVTKRDLEIVQDVLRRMDLEECAHREVNALSGGERQKVSIARALAQQAPVLLFDEPTSSLDLRNQLEVLDMTKQVVRQQGLAAVVILHDLNLALRFADRFLVMKEGTVRAFGGREVVDPGMIREVYGVQAQVLEVNGRPVVVPQ